MTRPRFSVTRQTTLHAQKLRREATPFERTLWSKLNHRQLGGRAFRRQHAVGPFILDFYCPALKLAVEIDGDSHGWDGAAKRDTRRTAYLEARGISVIRFWNSDVSQSLDGVVDCILAACEAIERRAYGALE
jgi:very-short-patch-repair endonuclease